MAYNDDDIVVVRGGSRRGSGLVRDAGNELFKTKADDSALKTVTVWGLAIGAAYFGGKLLLGNLSKTIEEHQVDVIKENAQKNPNTAAGLAVQLASAFQTTDGATIYAWTDVNEATIFSIFESKKIQTRDFFVEVAAAYGKVTKGRNLLTDLQNEMGSIDYGRIKPILDKIMATARKKATALAGYSYPPATINQLKTAGR